MSFFLQANKSLQIQGAQAQNPSPCQYNPVLQPNRQTSCAPFGSTVLRRLNTERKKAEILVKPQEQQMELLKDIASRLKAVQQPPSFMFKSESERFLTSRFDKPGPGSYELATKSKPNLARDTLCTLLAASRGRCNSKVTPPSIPTDHLGYQEDQHKEMKKVQPIPGNPPSPGSYELKSTMGSKGVLPWKPSKAYYKEEDQPGPGWYERKDRLRNALSSCFNSTTGRFMGKQTQKKPGPGQYNPEQPAKLSYNISQEAGFNSKTTRFEEGTSTRLGPGCYFDERPKAKSVANFRAGIDETGRKKSVFEIVNKNPGPGEYRTNFGINYQLQKQLMRKHSASMFPMEKRAVFETKEELPGPGSYQLDQREQGKAAKIHRNVKIVNLRESMVQSPSLIDHTTFNHTIEAKITKQASRLTLTDNKPFNSNTERFKHYSKKQSSPADGQPKDAGILTELNTNKRLKRLVMITVKVRVPFETSSSKFKQTKTNYEGPDYYDKSAHWVKPSFSVKAKPQLAQFKLTQGNSTDTSHFNSNLFAQNQEIKSHKISIAGKV